MSLPLRLVVQSLLLLATAQGLAAQRFPAMNAPLEPGDRVMVRILADSVAGDTARVDHRGFVTLPIVGRVATGGIAVDALVDSIRNRFATSFRGAVDVIPLRRVTVSGAVARPGVFYLEPQVSLREAIAVAGGVSEIGSTGPLQLSRGGDRLKVADWQRKMDDETVVRSGDVIWVERQSWLRRNALSAVSAAGVLLSIIVTLAAK